MLLPGEKVEDEALRSERLRNVTKGKEKQGCGEGL